MENGYFSQESWRHLLNDKLDKTVNLSTPSSYEDYFDTVYRIRSKQPSAHVARYALGAFIRRLAHMENCGAAVDPLLRVLIAAPEAAGPALQGIRDCVEDLGASIGERADKLVVRCLSEAVTSIHDGEVASMLWYCLSREIALPTSIVTSIFESLSSPCKIMALQAYVREKGVGGLAGLGLAPITDEDLSGPDWLFHYERYVNGWAPGLGVTGVSAAFTSLKKENFHFFRPEVVMLLNENNDADADEEEAGDDGWYL